MGSESKNTTKDGALIHNKTKNKTASTSVDKRRTLTDNKKTIVLLVLVAAVIALVAAIIALISTLDFQPKTYSISIQDIQNEVCSNDKDRKTCTGKIDIPANATDSGLIPSHQLTISVDNDGTLDTEAEKLPEYKITESEYSNARTAQEIIGAKKTITLRKDNRVKVVYTVDVRYKLSDDDRQKIASLDDARLKRIAEEKARKEQEEKARLEAEARAKLAKTPFTYISSACGFQPDVYCLLLSDFVNDDMSRDRVRVTFNEFIDKTSNTTKTKHLIYIFVSRDCYDEKIESRGLSVCNVQNGQVAFSMDTQGITYANWVK